MPSLGFKDLLLFCLTNFEFLADFSDVSKTLINLLRNIGKCEPSVMQICWFDITIPQDGYDRLELLSGIFHVV